MTSASPGAAGPARSGLSWVWPWLAVVALWWWAGHATPWALLAAAVGVVAAVAVEGGGRSRVRAVGVALSLAGILVGFHAQRQIDFVVHEWDEYWRERVDEVRDLLSEELDRRQIAGEAAADELIDLWLGRSGPFDPSALPELRERHRASAIALYDVEGGLVAWDGTHRGKVPESVQRGERRRSYRDLPLFGYLYLTARGDDGSVAVATYLLRAALPEGLGARMGDLASRFYDETGERIRITEEDPGFAEAVWDLALDDDRLLSVVPERPERLARAAAVRARWSVVVAVIGFVAWLLLAIGGPLTRGEASLATLSLVAGAALVPLGSWGVPAGVLDAATYGLPSPLEVTLGRLALVLATLFTVVAVLARRQVRFPVWSAALGVGLLYPVLLAWVGRGTTPALLAAGRTEWIVLQLVCAAVLVLPAGILLAGAVEGRGSRPWAVAAVALAAGLAGWVGILIGLRGSASVLWSAAWAGPAAMAAWSLGAWPRWQRDFVGWGLAAVIGSSAAVPYAWGVGLEARLEEGAHRLGRLAAVEDVEVEDRLVDFAHVADSLDAAGAEDVSILYEGWRRSGLADLGHPVWLQIEERDGSPGEGLRVGVGEGEPQPYQEILAQGRRAGGVRLVHLNEDDARYVLTAELRGGRMLVAVAPPFPETDARSALGPLLRGSRNAELEALSVVALPEGEAVELDAVHRSRTRSGWQVETALRFSNGPTYLAQYAVARPGLLLAVARGTLLVMLDGFLLLAFWVAGRALLPDGVREGRAWTTLVISFRARVTLALFGFFALANALFGTVAYRTLAQASRRSAQVIAERVVDDAAGWYQALGGQMERLANQVGAELLEYRDGELEEGSLEELVELGLYEAWIPPELGARLRDYRVEQEFWETSIGRWEYVTAYRRLPDGDVLAAQVPLQAGTSALQTTDLVELLGFVVLVGAALSFGLAMIAGRALTRPILALQIASESVGSGDLGLRLPAHRNDEFGAVFRAFNRMVGRVRRARRQLVRTSRRTQLIMDEAAVGMVALDPGGRVTLVNPRAEELLGTEVFVGRSLPGEGELGEALTRWLDDYLAGSAEEANSDFQVGERRVRVRARRLGTFGTRRGVVVALDDVTDELRAERVLAWGEMARQVAHEVKNPLTPIKLSIQHVRRAWDDQRPDFDEILVRNADAMLSEIDRLAEIAQSFSRFGAPSGQVVALAPVSLQEVVVEVMALYGGSAARIRFEERIERGLSPVVARAAELKEVLVNLLENARMAGGEGTVVTIRGERGDDPDTVILRVVDNGAGIPEDVLPRIFEPQFSTRSKGAGLGLAIVQRVVRAWGGTVAVESEVGKGTTVSVTLRVWADREARATE